MKKEIAEPIKEKINKERRYMLIGIFTIFFALKVSSRSSEKKKSSFLLINLVFKVISLLKMIIRI